MCQLKTDTFTVIKIFKNEKNTTIHFTSFANNSFCSTNNAKSYWKNATPFNLSVNNGGATGIAVAGKDVYTSGYEQNVGGTNYNAKYWKNSISYPLSNSPSTANAIFLTYF